MYFLKIPFIKFPKISIIFFIFLFIILLINSMGVSQIMLSCYFLGAKLGIWLKYIRSIIKKKFLILNNSSYKFISRHARKNKNDI